MNVKIRVEADEDVVKTVGLLAAVDAQYVAPFEKYFQETYKGPLLITERQLLKAFVVWIAINQSRKEDGHDGEIGSGPVHTAPDPQ